MSQPLIIYVPGLLPKPPAKVHAEALWRCLLEGVRRADGETAAALTTQPACFELLSWTWDFYREDRDYTLDATSVDALFNSPGASEMDIREASSFLRRATVWMYMLGDRLPFLIPHLASEKMEVHIRDLRRYVRNVDGIARHTRDKLQALLREAATAERPVLLIAHSMGSVIAYDSLWEMSHVSGDTARVDCLLTMGSPLGQNYLQKRILGRDEQGAKRYPDNIRKWVNLAAIGELTAIDRVLANDFKEMLELGLVESISDRPIYNAFRLDGQLNVHAEYGYLINDACGVTVADWWRSVS
jgi:hypothetical protein